MADDKKEIKIDISKLSEDKRHDERKKAPLNFDASVLSQDDRHLQRRRTVSKVAREESGVATLEETPNQLQNYNKKIFQQMQADVLKISKETATDMGLSMLINDVAVGLTDGGGKNFDYSEERFKLLKTKFARANKSFSSRKEQKADDYVTSVTKLFHDFGFLADKLNDGEYLKRAEQLVKEKASSSGDKPAVSRRV